MLYWCRAPLFLYNIPCQTHYASYFHGQLKYQYRSSLQPACILRVTCSVWHKLCSRTQKYILGDQMVDELETNGDRRTGADRRSSEDRRSRDDRRSGTDRRSEEDRRSGWGRIKDKRLQGALTTAVTVAHLFSQPLTIVMGYVDLLAANIEEENNRQKLKIIKEQLQSLSMILQNLRNLREYKTIDINGLTLLDIGSGKAKQDD